MSALLLTWRSDYAADLLVLELQRQGQTFIRLNLDDPDGISLSWTPERGGRIRRLDCTIGPDDVTGVWSRGIEPTASFVRQSSEVELLQLRQWIEAVRSCLFAIPDARWVNACDDTEYASTKARQLSVASEVGLKVPDTVITNDPSAWSYLGALHQHGSVIGKPLQAGRFDDSGEPRAMFSMWIDASAATEPGVTEFPMILQEAISPGIDVRVTVVDGDVFGADIILLDAEPPGVRDWRCVPRNRVHVEATNPPDEVSEALVTLTRRLGLRYCAYDLIRCPDGQYWFFEANPSGQWGFQGDLSERITARLVGALREV